MVKGQNKKWTEKCFLSYTVLCKQQAPLLLQETSWHFLLGEKKKKGNETLLLIFRVGFMKRSFSTNSGTCTKYVVSPRTAGLALQEPGLRGMAHVLTEISSTWEFQVKANMWEVLRLLIKRSIKFFQGNFIVCIKRIHGLFSPVGWSSKLLKHAVLGLRNNK